MRSRDPLLEWAGAPEGEGEWRCPYCGAVMPDGVDHPAVWECCGEMGHAEHWVLRWDNRNKVNGSKWVKSEYDDHYRFGE